MKPSRLMGKGEILFIPKAFFSLVIAPWVLFRTSWGQYSRTFSWPAGSQAWNRQEVIKGAGTAAPPHPPTPLGWGPPRWSGESHWGRVRDNFHVCFSVRRDTKHSMTGLVGHSSLLLGWMTVLKVKVWGSHLDWYLGCALMPRSWSPKDQQHCAWCFWVPFHNCLPFPGMKLHWKSLHVIWESLWRFGFNFSVPT